MVAVLKLLRPGNCLMGLVGVLIGAMVGKGLDIFSDIYIFYLLVGMVIAFFFMAAGNMLNDYFDSELDKINHPERPIPSGAISENLVIISAGAIFVILLVLGITVNSIMFLILVFATLLMVGYELVFKRLGFPGNIVISILVGMLFLFGAAVVKEFGAVIILALLAGLATLTREIVKDIQDIKGDLDRSTLPKQIGIRKSGILATIVIILAILLSPFPAFPEFVPCLVFDRLSIGYLILIIPADLLFIASIYNFTIKPKRASTLLKAGMAVSLLAFVIGSIIV